MLIGKKHCVKASLLSTRLLSKEDKQDMLNGELPMDSLENHVIVWKQNGMADCTNGNLMPFNDVFFVGSTMVEVLR